jgi:N,N'-diacetyllegionaminate synthase
VNKTLIIAEAGVNHNGDIAMAKKLIDVAANAGADYVKFQTFKTEKIVSPLAKKADYQKNNITSGNADSQFDMLKKLELSKEHHLDLINHCKEKNIRFLSTAFDLESIDLLAELNIDLFKIPSGEMTNLPFLRKIGKHNKMIVLSTGMSELGEIRESIEVLVSSGTKREKITILHCNTDYPTKMEDVNLSAMIQLKKEFGIDVGYSDHTLGIEVPIAAVALGATIIEKHFTVSRELDGPDHKASLEPEELKQMVKAIRNIECALSGSGEKKPSKSEEKNRSVARKSIHLNLDLHKGEKIKEEHLICLRPGDGISPMEWDKIIGMIPKKDLKQGHKLVWEDIE